MNRYELAINGIPVAVEILSISGGLATVSVNGSTFQVRLPAGASSPLTRPTRAAPASQTPPPRPAPVPEPAPTPVVPTAAAPAVGGEDILAPMPGQIVKVLIRLGDEVSVGTPVVLMEAMKMENEIQSHVAGRVAAVRVSDGQTVRVNDALVVIQG